MQAFAIGTMGQRPLSRREQEEKRKREEEEAAANVNGKHEYKPTQFKFLICEILSIHLKGFQGIC